MFSNIPTIDCLKIIKDRLDRSSVNIIKKLELYEALELCLNQNYFQFNNKFYKQTSGLAMGSPLSPLLAEIFMSNIEERIFSQSCTKNHIAFWFRYVDDIIACFSGTDRQLDQFLKIINNIHPKIKFSIEIEKEEKPDKFSRFNTQTHK